MSDLSQRIHQDLKSAMIRQDRLQRNTLRFLSQLWHYVALKSGKDDLSDLEAIRVIQKEAKKRKEAHEQFLKGSRAEQSEQERQELHVLEAYLPKPFTEEELRTSSNCDLGAGCHKQKRHESSDSVCSVCLCRRLVGNKHLSRACRY